MKGGTIMKDAPTLDDQMSQEQPGQLGNH